MEKERREDTDKMEVSWLLTVAVGLLTVLLIKYFMSRPKNLPPGPSQLILLKGVWNLIRGRTEPLALFSSWAEKYGEIMCFYAGTRPFVVLNSYQVIVEAFRHPDLNDRPPSDLISEIYNSKNYGIVLANGGVWKDHRKFIHSVFRSLGVGKKTYEDTIASEMSQLSEAIRDKKGAPFNPNVLFGRAVSNIICSIMFGTQYRYEDKELLNILDIINANFQLSGGGGLLFFLPFPGIAKIPFGNAKKIVDSTRDLHAYILAQIENHEKSLDTDNPRDFIDQYVIKLSETEGKGTSFSKLNLLASVTDTFAAGYETTSTTLKWCILYMMAYPKVQSRVQEELDHVVGRDRLPRLDDRTDLPYTSAVLMEAQRKGAVVAFGVPHIAAANTVVKGYTIPKGATIVSNIWRVLNNEEDWKDPESFNPERFLDKDGQLMKRNELIFFSAGRRVCLGEQLARMETFLGFTSLLHQFTFKKPADSPPLCFKGVFGMTRNTTPFMACAFPRE